MTLARIEFRGAINIIPLRHKDGRTTFLAGLVDLRTGLQRPQLPYPISPHVPAIVVRSDQVRAQTYIEPDLEFAGNEASAFGKARHSLYSFDDELLTLDGTTSDCLQFAMSPLPKTSDPSRTPVPGPHNEQDLMWVPPMGHADNGDRHGCGAIDGPRLLNANLTPRDGVNDGGEKKADLVGTVHIDRGHFYVDGVVVEGDEPLGFGFRAANNPDVEWRQAIYTRLIWDVECEDTLELVLKHGESERRRSIQLSSGGDRYDIVIANLELETLLAVGGIATPISNADGDYAVGYMLCKNVPTLDQGMPVPFWDGPMAGMWRTCHAALREELPLPPE